jgi:hypothetical protein
MDDPIRSQLVPGAKVAVTQQIPHGQRTWAQEVQGTVVLFEQKPTGSWFAHAQDQRLWLDRLVIRKDDGEITTLNLDQYSAIRIESAPATPQIPET